MYYVEQDFITYLSVFCPDSNTKNGNAIHVVNETDGRYVRYLLKDIKTYFTVKTMEI